MHINLDARGQSSVRLEALWALMVCQLVVSAELAARNKKAELKEARPLLLLLLSHCVSGALTSSTGAALERFEPFSFLLCSNLLY